MNTFTEDLKKAKIIENKVADAYRLKGFKVTLAPDRYFPDYDMIIEKNNIRQTVEVKTDYMALTGRCTGNCCFEYTNNRGEKTGISAGDENGMFLMLYHIKENHYKFFICTKKQIREYSQKNHEKIVSVHDGNSICYLYKLSILEKQFKLKDVIL